MRVLILSCNTGEGHNSSGKAVQEAFQRRNIPCEMEDAFRFISSGTSSFISYGFVRVYRHLPGLFRFGYRYSEEHPGVFGEKSGIYKMITAGAERLYHFIKDEGYDTVICTHVFSGLITTEILRRYHISLRTYFVATDYTCSPSCAESELDAYFIPDESLKDDFARCGIPREKLVASGIPIREAFFRSEDAASAKRSIGLKPDCKHLLVMCGSMGCGPIRKLVKLISQILPEDCHISVICGTNHRLRKKLESDHAHQPRIHAYGFIKNIPTMMDSADLYLTKPGGISTTEAGCKQLPMVFVNAVAGCETYNMRFFTGKGAAVTADTPEELAVLTVALLKDSHSLHNMSAACQGFLEESPAEFICEYILREATVKV